MIQRSWWLTGLFGLVIVASLPFIGNYVRRGAEDRCSWDGLDVNPIYQVTVVEEPGVTYRFCSILCAEHWLGRRRQRVTGILLTDEAGGTEIEATDAIFVRSSVVTNDLTGNRIHVFRLKEDAMKHATATHGQVLADSESPFANIGLTAPGTP